MRQCIVADTTPHALDSLVLSGGKKMFVGDFLHIAYEPFHHGHSYGRRDVTGFVTCIVEYDGHCECGEEHRLVDIKVMTLDGETDTIVSAHVIDIDSVEYEVSDAVMSVVASVISTEKKLADARATLVSAERRLRTLPDDMRLASGKLDDKLIARIAEEELTDALISKCLRSDFKRVVDDLDWRAPTAHAQVSDGRLCAYIEFESGEGDAFRAPFCTDYDGEPYVYDQDEDALLVAEKLYRLAFHDDSRDEWVSGAPYERLHTSAWVKDRYDGIISLKCWLPSVDITDCSEDGVRKLARDIATMFMSD